MLRLGIEFFVKLKLRINARIKDYRAIITSVLSGREKV